MRIVEGVTERSSNNDIGNMHVVQMRWELACGSGELLVLEPVYVVPIRNNLLYVYSCSCTVLT